MMKGYLLRFIHCVRELSSLPCNVIQVLDKNTCRLVAGEYDMLVVDKAEAGITDGG